MVEWNQARGRVPSASGASAAATEDVDDSDLDLSASLWFQTLDKILSAKGAASRAAGSVPEPGGSATGMAVPGGDVASSSGLGKVKRRRQVAGELPQTAALMQGVLDALLQRTLSSMAGDGRYQSGTVLIYIFREVLCGKSSHSLPMVDGVSTFAFRCDGFCDRCA